MTQHNKKQYSVCVLGEGVGGGGGEVSDHTACAKRTFAGVLKAAFFERGNQLFKGHSLRKIVDQVP